MIWCYGEFFEMRKRNRLACHSLNHLAQRWKRSILEKVTINRPSTACCAGRIVVLCHGKLVGQWAMEKAKRQHRIQLYVWWKQLDSDVVIEWKIYFYLSITEVKIIFKNLSCQFRHFPCVQTFLFYLQFQIPSINTSNTYVLPYVYLVLIFSRIRYPANSLGKSGQC